MRIRCVSVWLVVVEVERARWRRRIVVRESGEEGGLVVVVGREEWVERGKSSISTRGFSISVVGVDRGDGDEECG